MENDKKTNDRIKGGDVLEVVPQKLVYEGAALAKPDGYPVFIDGACPGDKLKIKIPSYDIQRKIAQHISLFDNEITLYKETLKSLIRQHKAMQQLLLSGIVRL